jgi:hypothetical protein
MVSWIAPALKIVNARRGPRHHAVLYHPLVPTEIEDEISWLRHRIVRMRTILRFAKDTRIEAGPRELITDAEARLTALEAKRPRGIPIAVGAHFRSAR